VEEWLSTVPATADDEPFLYQVYASTRVDEMAAWGWSELQLDAFLRMQFSMQQRSYALQYPEAEHLIVLHRGQSIGKTLIFQTNMDLTLVDVALLPEFRNSGLGSALIKGLQERASRQGGTLRLSVLRTNVARHLYERLGFHITGEHGMHLTMEWRSRLTV